MNKDDSGANLWQKDEQESEADTDLADFDIETENNNKETEDIYNDNKIKHGISPQWGFGFLVVLAMGVLAYGFINLSKTINGSTKIVEETAVNTPKEDTTIEDLAALQNKDTDQDGLNDYDEQYVYKTSVYLADSDSDGYTDREEIQSGHDPLCPAGKDCRGNTQNNNTSTEVAVPLPPDLNDTTGTDTEISPEALNQLLNMTPDEVRNLLKESGQLTEEQISQISDDELMQIFKDTISNEANK